jgi:hypothetical protein
MFCLLDQVMNWCAGGCRTLTQQSGDSESRCTKPLLSLVIARFARFVNPHWKALDFFYDG